MKTAVVVNCSNPHYNLGAYKLTDWLAEQGCSVHHFNGDPGLFMPETDLVCLSVIFSWHALIYAPCWQNGDSAALFPELVNLRLEAEGMVSADDVAAWIERCLEIGIDPL